MASVTPARRVLVVDDEEHVCNALRRTLAREGYQVETFSSAVEALEVLRATPFDLVISDHLMPDMTGIEFLQRVRDRHPDVVRIMLTGQADTQTAIDAINHGEIYRFLTKPWDDVELKVCLTLAFEKLDLEREHRALLARARAGADPAVAARPPVPTVERDESGAIVIDS